MNNPTSVDKEQEEQRLRERLGNIRHVILVLSGKGGVGKSTVAANLAAALASDGNRVGLLDIDVHGPSIPGMFGLEGQRIDIVGDQMIPVNYNRSLSVMSIGFMLENRHDAVIWRGPMKYGVIKQFLSDVEWGELDYLVVDSPPGTGDEPLSIAQLVGKGAGAVLVTTPQKVSTDDVRKSVQFCRALELDILGIIENMSGFVCPECQTVVDIFSSGGGEQMAQELAIPFLAKVPIEPGIVSASDAGTPHVLETPDSKSSAALREAVKHITTRYGQS